jgi:trigger factor
MDITKENIDELNAVVKIKVDKGDYDERVNNILKDYRKKARIDGFRPGKVPPGLISKMYRKPVMVDEVNKIVTEALFSHIRENDIKILGEPLPSEREKSDLDFENNEEFQFIFDLGLAPEFELNLSMKDKIPLYKIKVTDELINQSIDNIANRFGEFVPADQVKKDEILKGKITQVEASGNPVEEAFSNEEADIRVDLIKEEKIKKQFKGLKKGDSITFDLRKAFPNDTEIAGILKLENKDEAKSVEGDFVLHIDEVSSFKPAEVNQEFFDKVYGEENVKSLEEFKEKIKEELENNYARESEQRFMVDAKEALLKKTNFELPAEFLKRWLVAVNEDKFSQEQIEKDFPTFEDDLKWQLIRDRILKDNDIKIGQEDMMEYAKQVGKMQFMQYGLAEVPEDHLENYAKQILENEEERKRIYDNLSQDFALKFIKDNVKVDEKELSLDKFNKLYEKQVV